MLVISYLVGNDRVFVIIKLSLIHYLIIDELAMSVLFCEEIAGKLI